MFLTLTRAIAALNGRTETTPDDVKEIVAFGPFFNSITFEGDKPHAETCKPLALPPSWVRNAPAAPKRVRGR